jgi:hypothetical protein
MADLTVDGRMKVKTLKEEFKKSFGVSIRVYSGKKFADDDATLASIRAKDAKKGGSFSIHGRTKVVNVEKSFKEEMGITVQIEDKKGDLADNNLSLAEAAR